MYAQSGSASLLAVACLSQVIDRVSGRLRSQLWLSEYVTIYAYNEFTYLLTYAYNSGN